MSDLWAYEPHKCDGDCCRMDCDRCRKAEEEQHLYGMRLRGYSIGCQPKAGFIERLDDNTGRYHDILAYDRQLSPEELEDYELDYLGKENEK